MGSSARDHLGLKGPLPHLVDRYEEREGQLAMAEAVERALDEDRILLCEAATGTGKTLGYLVPALLSGRRVVVATASRALQDQIYFKDLPLAREVTGVGVSATLVKGLGNYLCRRRFELFRDGPTTAGQRGRDALPVVQTWVGETERGDVSELSSLPEQHPIWAAVTSSSETRLGSRCPHHERCFVTQLKRRAETSTLLVVNHHLLLADLAIRGEHPARVLPDYDAVIIDEAHKLEDVATDFFGLRVTSRHVERLLDEAERVAPEDAPLATVARKEAEALFGALNLALGRDDRRPWPPDAWTASTQGRYFALDDALAALASRVSSRAGSEEPSLSGALQLDAGVVSMRLSGVRQSLADLVEPDAHQVVYLAREAAGRGVALTSRPVHVGPLLGERLFDRGPATVLCSASLTAEGRFDFLRSRLGLDEPRELPVDELKVDSPFDHRHQALLYTPTDLPAVDDPDFVTAATERLTALVDLTPGGAFVLCTSNRSLKGFARALAGAGLDRPLLVQGQAPKATLLKTFREERDAVLVATMSFWEGVDVPGPALRLVVIDRIPFAVPTDPVVAARAAALQAAGRVPFKDDALPRAALVLKQGYGRLVRHRDDVGVVAIFDRRVATRNYGAVLIESLPPARQTRDLGDVEAFWRDVTGT